MKAPAVGIDLGTTNSCVGVYISSRVDKEGHVDKEGRVEIIENSNGNRTTPSQVAFSRDGRFIGDAAKNQAGSNYENSIYGAKRLIGRRFSDPVVQEDIKLWPFKVIRGSEDRPKLQVTYRGETRSFFPEEISSMVLTDLKETAETYIGEEVTSAVITVPAYFNDSQRQATKDAGRIAGLTVERIINEPTAAAIAYGIGQIEKGNDSKKKTVLVFDLGGGTFDVSILRIYGGEFKVLATDGDTHLGGEDFDNRLLEHFIKEFERKKKVSIRGDGRAMRRLKTACERAKRQLSSASQAQVEVDGLYQGIDLFETLTRARFEELCADFFNDCVTVMDKCLKDSGVTKAQVDEIIMVGGSTRIPKVQRLVKEYFGGKDLCKSVNPDEVVAQGATIQAAILSQASDDKLDGVVLHDVTPLSLGIQVEGKLMSTVIRRHSPVPIWKEQVYATAHDNQTSVLIQVFEGERPNTADNNLLGDFKLTNLPALPRGKVALTVTFEIDENGILKVSAAHEQTGNREDITITNNKGRLSDTEIAIMVEDARDFKDQDDAYRARANARNDLANYAYAMREKTRIESDSIKQASHDRALKVVSETISWIDATPDATKEQYDRKNQQIHRVFSTIFEE